MLIILIFLFFLLTIIVDNAYAYIDFGTGSYVLQILAASAIGVIFYLKNHLRRIKDLFKRKTPSDKNITSNLKE